MLASVCNKLSSKPFHLAMGDVACCLYILHSVYASKCLQQAVIKTFPFSDGGRRLLSAHCTLSVYWQVFTTEQYFLNGVAAMSSISAKLEHLFLVF